ncbi:MAG: ASCH domain-containing protein [Phycisphaerae bacterium]
MDRSGERIWKCLTVCQPWAWCIVHGPKQWENRSWRCHYRGPLLIHAGRSRARLTPEVYDWLSRRGIEPPPPQQLVYGAIIGVCKLVDCLPVEQLPTDPWADGPWCLKLADARPLPQPIPCQGKLRLFDAKLAADQVSLLKSTLAADAPACRQGPSYDTIEPVL